MEKNDLVRWQDANITGSTLNYYQRHLISELHAKYFNHKMTVLGSCPCNAKTFKQWIADLNSLL